MSYNHLALALKDEGKFEASMEAIRISDSLCLAINDRLGLTRGNCTRGNVSMYMGNHDEATHSLMKCIEGLGPNDPKQAGSRVIEQQNLANVFANTGNHTYADLLYGQCADKIRDMGRTYQWLQVCNNQISSKINIGQLDESLAEAERAMALMDNAPRQAHTIRKEYAMALDALSRHAEVVALVDRVMAEWPENQAATEEMVHLKLEWIRAQAALSPKLPILQQAATIATELDEVLTAMSSERMAVMAARYQLEEQLLKNRQQETDNALLEELADQTQSRNLSLGITLFLLVVMGGLAIRSSRLKSKALAGGLAQERAQRSELELVTTMMELASFERKLDKVIESAEATGASEQTLRPFRSISQTGDFLKAFKLRFENIHPGFSDALQAEHPELTANAWASMKAHGSKITSDSPRPRGRF